MAVKTKNELLEEIEQKNKEIEVLKADVEKLEKYRKYDEMTDEVKAINESFVRSGFTEQQAFELTRGAVTAAAGRPTLF
jgi:hypothetical protein